MMLSRNLDERFEKTTISAKMTDVPGHTRGIVPLLQRAGVRLFHIGVNGASMPPETPSVFVWQAPDASRVTVMIQKEYGGIMRIPTEEVVAILFTGDNHGPQTAAQVAEAYRNLEEQFPGAEVVASDLNEVARSLPAWSRPFPSSRPNWATRGFMASARIRGRSPACASWPGCARNGWHPDRLSPAARKTLPFPYLSRSSASIPGAWMPRVSRKHGTSLRLKHWRPSGIPPR